MTKKDFVEEFRMRLALIPTYGANPEGFARYQQDVSYLRSLMVYRLRLKGYPGKVRSVFNDSVNWLIPDYKDYLFKISPLCSLCGFHMFSKKIASRDHIVERGVGGAKGIRNQQLAHPWCNVMKSADFNKIHNRHGRNASKRKR